MCVCKCSVAQSCLTLCDLTDCSPPGSSVHGILQARILGWVAFSSPGDFSNPGIELVSPRLAGKILLSLSHLLLLLLSRFNRVRLCVTPQTAAHQALLSLGFSRQEHWSGLSFPSPMHACVLSHFSHGRLCASLWTAAHQAPLSTGVSRQEYWSGLPFSSPTGKPRIIRINGRIKKPEIDGSNR